MELNFSLLEEIKKSNSKLLAVTKYYDEKNTKDILLKLEENNFDILYGLGENRVENIYDKNIVREKLHFIGNLQTKKLRKIAKNFLFIHSLDDLIHAKKLDSICKEENLLIKVFIQINLDKNKSSGIDGNELPNFLEEINKYKELDIIGITGMGRLDFTTLEKEREFDYLISLRNKYLPNGLISAGTSTDYKIALDKSIDVIRIGRKLIL